MNKRMEELLKQSGLQPYYESQQGDIEKFAELIVTECMLLCYHNDDMDRIEKHFGVEE